ncbi:MAG: amino acid adenylation domain-containing protein, partial [Leptolyngbyaceae cyanobacterium SM1_3_5]|nr:amino acid adenylation domain-containing protein [Leptolyngbyaceae cyanobacterium SM1_3_5]
NFAIANGNPTQIIHPTHHPQSPLLHGGFRGTPLTVKSLESLTPKEQQAAIEQFTTAAAQTPFNLEQDSLLRIVLLRQSDRDHVLLLTMHHIIADGWSMDVLLRELVALYEAAATGKPAALPELPIQYADFAIWQRDRLQGDVLETLLNDWKQQLAGELPILQLPIDYPRSRVQSFRGAIESFTLSAELSDRLKTLAQTEGVTLFMLLLTAYNVLLHRYTGQTDILVGAPIAGRNRPEIEGLIGFFVNTLVLRTDLEGNPTFQTLLQQVRQVTWAAFDRQDLPFEKLVEALAPDRDLSYSPLFQVKFRLENAPTTSIEVPGLTLSLLSQTNPAAKLDLSLDLYETASGLVGSFEYNRDLFAPETIARMVGHFQRLLAAITASPTERIADLPMLTEAEQRQLRDWNQTQIEYDDRCFHQIFEAQVERSPDAIALIFNDQQLTYRELNRRSNQLAHHLQRLGVRPETLVALCIDRSPEMIIALLAILKAGGAYLPLDPTYPIDRLSFMLENSQAAILITNSAAPSLPVPKRINLDAWEFAGDDHNPTSRVTTDNLAYLVYTSGSTGVPKGVLVSHAGLANLTKDKIRVCQVQPDSCVLQFFSLSFDASIPEIVMALGSGAKLCLASIESLLPGTALLQLLREQAVTHITITPSALSALPLTELPALQMVLVGGEAPSADLIARWSQNRRFINAYGPTETTVNASMVPCDSGDPPTLRPSANKQLHILDRHLQPVPIGVAGELHIGGVGLARGYLDRPDLTGDRFIPNPFAPGRLYRTGDLACYRPDGRIKLLGRIDQQVKIRGFRIEPGEIEALLTQHPDVQSSAVIVHERGEKRLVAYVVSARQTSIDFRRFLREKLPEYMVPSAVILLDSLPLTPNGKIDYRSLPHPDQITRTEAIVAPRTELEKAIAAIFTDVLEVKKISITDDFFELGGHSLLATRLIAQLQQTCQLEISVADLFEAPTIAELADRITLRQTQETLLQTDSSDEREEIEI